MLLTLQKLICNKLITVRRFGTGACRLRQDCKIDTERELIAVPRKNLELGEKRLFFRGPVVWNCLEKTAQECNNIDDFKIKVKKLRSNSPQGS